MPHVTHRATHRIARKAAFGLKKNFSRTAKPRCVAPVLFASSSLVGQQLKLLFYTAIRVSELVRIEVNAVDLDRCKIFINHGKGAKDRYILFPAIRPGFEEPPASQS